MRINVTIKLGISYRIAIPVWGVFLFIYKERRKNEKNMDKRYPKKL